MKSFFFALQHLTRIRLYQGAFDDRAFGRSPVFFPAVGLLLGLLLWLAKVFFDLVFPDPLVAALLVVTMAVLTGGIHLDGFMDTMDGVLSGRPREKKLEIMRDSRVGSHGVVAGIIIVLAKLTLLGAIHPACKIYALL
ncbi:MAG: adenosylcobinamide-GDP ribazoletransferase, partial [Desulfotomaculaceae bacterium]